ncbi:MAG: RluA family pseudouridine synthase [Ruminococcaceae bacterium]|nr:RluA family pseudouridine synthase [Oscillospiraceae bacterium]
MELREKLSFLAQSHHDRLDYFLKGQGISHRIITKLKYLGCLLINGKPVTTRHPVSAGDEVTLLFPKETEISCEPEQGIFTILYEDGDLMAVVKPYGIATHPALGTANGTLGNFVTQYYVDNGCPMPFRPVSRLDKTTSGVLVVAKHGLSHHILSNQKQNGSFRKLYLALVTGVPEKMSGEITFPIARESETSLKRVCRDDGKPAHTCYRVLMSKENFSLLELELLTGRTHQIRVHLSQIGHPIVGDTMYGGISAKRLYLHSHCAQFPHPITGKLLEIHSPSDFETILSTIENEDFYDDYLSRN